MRESYNGPTPETKKALEKHVKAVADELHKSTQYIHAILSGASSDPFKKFFVIFRAVARKNREGARGYVGALLRTLNESEPNQIGGQFVLDSVYHNLKAVLARREDGLASDDDVDRAIEMLVETAPRCASRARKGAETGV